MKLLLTLLSTCCFSILFSQKDCDKVVRLNHRMNDFMGDKMGPENPQKYCLIGGFYYVVSNETDHNAYDIIFDSFKGWKCTSNLNIRLYNFEDNSLVDQFNVKEEDVKYLYLTSFPKENNNLIIRFDDIKNLNLIYRLTISDDQNRELFNSGMAGINFYKYNGPKSCNLMSE